MNKGRRDLLRRQACREGALIDGMMIIRILDYVDRWDAVLELAKKLPAASYSTGEVQELTGLLHAAVIEAEKTEEQALPPVTLVRQLREKTGALMADCVQALKLTENNVREAEQLLRERP